MELIWQKLTFIQAVESLVKLTLVKCAIICENPHRSATLEFNMCLLVLSCLFFFVVF